MCRPASMGEPQPAGEALSEVLYAIQCGDIPSESPDQYARWCKALHDSIRDDMQRRGLLSDEWREHVGENCDTRQMSE